MTGTPPTDGNPGGAAQSWYSGLDDTDRAHVVAKGFDRLSGDALVQTLYKGYREIERLRGMPAEQIVCWPRDANDVDAWKNVKNRLGVPAQPTEYKFDGVAFKDGSVPEADYLERARALAFELNLPASAAPLLAKRVIEWGEAAEAAEAAENSARAGAEMVALKQSWGAEYDYKSAVAQKAFDLLGIPQETIDLMRNSVGFAKAMDGFFVLGSRMGEAPFLGGGRGPGAPNTMTREEAITRKAALVRDSEWAKRWMSGDVKALEEIQNLDRIIVGAPPQQAAAR